MYLSFFRFKLLSLSFLVDKKNKVEFLYLPFIVIFTYLDNQDDIGMAGGAPINNFIFGIHYCASQHFNFTLLFFFCYYYLLLSYPCLRFFKNRKFKLSRPYLQNTYPDIKKSNYVYFIFSIYCIYLLAIK